MDGLDFGEDANDAFAAAGGDPFQSAGGGL